MATIQKRRNRGGSTSFVAWVRVKPFKPVARAFESRAEASAWADDHAREPREHRSRGEFAGSWSSRLRDCGFHINHIHPEGWISSCHYVGVPAVTEDATAQQ